MDEALGYAREVISLVQEAALVRRQQLAETDLALEQRQTSLFSEVRRAGKGPSAYWDCCGVCFAAGGRYECRGN